MTRPVSLGLGLALTLVAAAPARASTSGQDPAPAAVDEARARAAALYQQGRSKFELFDFAGAIELWSEAYSLVPEGDPDAHSIRSALVHNLSIAHVRAFDVDEDVTHLRTAKMLLTRYIKEAEAMNDGSAEALADLEESNAKLSEVDAKLAVIEAEPDPESQGPEGPAGGTGDGPASDPGVPHPEEPGPGPDDPVVAKPGKPLVAAGAALMAVGAAGGGLGAAGAFMGQAAEQRTIDEPVENRAENLQAGRTANTLAVLGAAVGGTLLVTGAALLVVGVSKNKRASTARARVSPFVGPLSGFEVQF